VYELIVKYAPAINGATQYFIIGLIVFLVGTLMLVNKPKIWSVIPALYRFIIGTGLTFAGMWIAFGGWIA